MTNRADSASNIVTAFRGLIKKWNGKELPLAPEAQDIPPDQIIALSHQLEMEKRRNLQFQLLNELSRQLEHRLDEPVAAQITINMLEHAIDCSYACLYLYDAEKQESVVLASAGKLAGLVPPERRQSIERGVLGRAIRLRKTQAVPDTNLDPYVHDFENERALSTVVVPLFRNGQVRGAIQLNSEKTHAFHNFDVALVETAATELTNAWERSSYQQRLADLIQAGISLSTMLEPQAAVQEIATFARQTLQGRFTYVTLLDQKGNLTQKGSSGYAPKLLKSLEENPASDLLMKAALNATEAFRVRDVRKYSASPHIEIDHSGLRSVLAIPIRLHRWSIGAILVFGKQAESSFTENDESLAGLLATRAAAAIESVWLYQELYTTSNTTKLLYQLSFDVIQAEELSEAAGIIAEKSRSLTDALAAGIVLFTPQGKIEAKVEVDSSGAHEGDQHPMDLVHQVMETGESIFISPDQTSTRICFPLKTPHRTYGVLWLHVPETHGSRHSAVLQTLANQAAVVLERALLLVESRRQAKELEAAYHQLEVTYDNTLAALMSALDARDRETEGHSLRVSQIARRLGESTGLSAAELKALERGSLLHDIGKIGISDTILHKPGPLDAKEWKAMRLHPDIGTRIVEDILFLQETLPVIRYHQERWDGSGYPVGLSGKEIPILARIFAVADAFDALTSDRPYRTKVSAEEALEYLRQQAGTLFDPQIVARFERMVEEGQFSDLFASE